MIALDETARVQEHAGVGDQRRTAADHDEVMFGLNDLRLQLGVANLFEVLASPLLDVLAAEVRRAGLPLAVGGVARGDDSSLPVSPDLVYAQFPRLGAIGAWLGRSFFLDVPPGWKLAPAIATMRRRLD